MMKSPFVMPFFIFLLGAVLLRPEPVNARMVLRLGAGVSYNAVSEAYADGTYLSLAALVNPTAMFGLGWVLGKKERGFFGFSATGERRYYKAPEGYTVATTKSYAFNYRAEGHYDTNWFRLGGQIDYWKQPFLKKTGTTSYDLQMIAIPSITGKMGFFAIYAPALKAAIVGEVTYYFLGSKGGTRVKGGYGYAGGLEVEAGKSTKIEFSLMFRTSTFDTTTGKPRSTDFYGMIGASIPFF